MTAHVCRRCGGDIQMRFVGSMKVWSHARPTVNHAVLPPKKTEPDLPESERRALWGDR